MRIFRFHRVDIAPNPDDASNWKGTCPFCGKENKKFEAQHPTTRYHCWSCDERGNNYELIRRIHERSVEETTTSDLIKCRREMGMPSLPSGGKWVKTTRAWGLAKHALSGEWCLPGYNADGRMVGLYVWRKMPMNKSGQTIWKPALLASPGMGHSLLGYAAVDWSKKEVDIAEGWRDGVAWSIASGRNVVSVPGTNSFRADWAEQFAGKIVNILFDNDHPSVNAQTGKLTQQGGPAGVALIARTLRECPSPPKQINYLAWNGEDTVDTILYNDHLPSGLDLRDITAVSVPSDASEDSASYLPGEEENAVGWLLGALTEVPELSPSEVKPKHGGSDLTALPCDSWEEMIGAWKVAMRWRREMSDILAIMMAVAVSTPRIGDQLMLMVIGMPGSGKSRFCDAMLVSKRYCRAVENMTGIISGWKTGQGGGKSHSLLERGNGQCWITSEADTMVKADGYAAMMGQIRRAFDGQTTASFKTMDEDMDFSALRFTWIKAGTPAMLTRDNAGLGDRFLKVRMTSPTKRQSRAIVSHVARAAWDDVLEVADGERQMNPAYQRAYALTAGYLEHLMDSMDVRLTKVQPDAEVLERVEVLAHRVAFFRSRPDPDEEVDTVVEQPTRVSSQLVRLTRCLAAVMGRETLDEDVDRCIMKVGTDSSQGSTWAIATILAEEGPTTYKALAIRTGKSEVLIKSSMGWLKEIGIVELNSPSGSCRVNTASWKLTELGDELTQGDV